MTGDAATHNDTYAESYHRDFFANYARGTPVEQCAGDEGHDTASMGGLVLLPPVILLLHGDRDAAVTAALRQMTLTHRSDKLAMYARVLVALLHDVLGGGDLRAAAERAGAQCGVDIGKLVATAEARNLPDTAIVGRTFSSACYIDDSFPSLLYLAARHAGNAEAALMANANCGGENCHKGAVLGAVLGAAYGVRAFPQRWMDGLRARDAIAQEIEAFVRVAVGDEAAACAAPAAL